jgi:N-acetylglucosamine-6-sulfatase
MDSGRRQITRVVACVLAVGWMAAGYAAEAYGQRPLPNIVFILSDNQRWDFMGCAGHPFVATPNLDRLASEGILFRNAFVTTSLCSPSRASFLTGQYAHTHGVRNNLTPWNDQNQTFLELLKQAGYESAFIGKWHMPGRLPSLRGVDLFVTFTAQKGQGRYFDCPLVVDGVEIPSRKPYITEELTDYALEFVSRPREGPFCLVLSHKAVHHRWLPPPDLVDLYQSDEPPFPREVNPLLFLTGGNLFEGLIGPPKALYRDYARVVTSLDRQIGRLLERIDEMGIADNTVVVFASDNGFLWGEHQRGGTGRWPYEESIRIPFIVRAPEMITNPGKRADQMVLNIDLAPSLLEMAGLPSPGAMEGESFVPVLKSPSAPGREAWLYEYFADFPFRVPTTHAVRTNRYTYIEFEGRKGRELYDIENDPTQSANLIHTQDGRRIAGELKKVLDDMRESDGPSDPTREEAMPFDASMR